MQYDITNGIANEQIELTNKYYTMWAILKLIDNCNKSYKGINCHISNQKSYSSDFEKAMISAIDSKSITIKRYFIIKNEVLNESTLFHNLIETMESNYRNGIKVSFILEEKVRAISFFRDKAIRGCGLYDRMIFSYDSAITSNIGGPHEITITLNKEKIRELNPFEHLDKSTLLKQYPKDKQYLRGLTNSQG